MANIKFGTDGWRAVTGEDFNSENVTLVTNAIAKYIFDKFGLDKKIIIGYDPRNQADVLSKLCADILVQKGFHVLYSKKVIPTPVLAFNAKYLNACAIMFTASHNPPEYLGLKFIPDYAGPATSEITDEIVKNIGETIENSLEGSFEYYDFSKAYFEHMENLIDFDAIKKSHTNIIFDGLYSATIGYFDKILKDNGIKFKTLHMKHDPNFGGGMPEPKPKYMQELIKQVQNSVNSVGFANDGDGDRFGVIDEKGNYVTPNEIIAILLMHLTKNKGLKGSLVKTVGASTLLDIVAEKSNVELIETAVGFKHVGEAMRKYNPVIGGEDSGGLSIQGHIPEKDGILANLLILEAMSYEHKTLVQLEEDLQKYAGAKFYNDRIDEKLETREQVTKALENAEKMKFLGKYKVTKVNKIDGVKLYFEDNSWILVRPSGTEPLLRIYIECDSLEKLEEFKENIKNASIA
ncbi:phosphoglucomutase/phosphomannomutase family protein [bacterium]|nr:phosphoglucomutase/phosphomannomutase family protein [bacterium]